MVLFCQRLGKSLGQKIRFISIKTFCMGYRKFHNCLILTATGKISWTGDTVYFHKQLSYTCIHLKLFYTYAKDLTLIFLVNTEKKLNDNRSSVDRFAETRGRHWGISLRKCKISSWPTHTIPRHPQTTKDVCSEYKLKN